MSQQPKTESPEKAKQRIERREPRPESTRSFQGGPNPILQLQRTLGNRRVAQLIQAKHLTPEGKIIGLQPKLTVGAADDQYEQEADRVARQVVSMPDSVALASVQQSRAVEGEPNQAHLVQSKPLPLAASITPFVQREMEQGAEKEEDHDREEDKDELLQAKFFNKSAALPFQRQTTSDEEETEPIQAKSGDSINGSFEAGDDVESRLGRSKGGGSPLPDPVRSYMEPRFGVDFSHVRVHTGSDAIKMNRDVGAQAFTHGSDVYFGAGSSPTNLELTAHELTHVVQQTGGMPLQPKRAPHSINIDLPARLSPTGDATANREEKKSISSSSLQRYARPASRRPSEAVTPQPGSNALPTAAQPPTHAAVSPASDETGTPSSPRTATPQTRPSGRESETGAGAFPAGPSSRVTDTGGPQLLLPEPSSDISEDDRSRLHQVQDNAEEATATETDLPPAETTAAEAREAVEEPEAEVDARAAGNLVAALEQREPPSPEIEDLCERIREVIRNKRPPDEEALVEADPEEMARQSGEQLNDAIESDTTRVQSSYDQLEMPPEGQTTREAQEIEPPAAKVAAPPINAETAVPEPVPEENISLDADVQANQQRMQDSGMNSEPAQLVQSGPIAEAQAAQGELESVAERDPAEVMAEQMAARDRAGTDMIGLQQRALEALASARASTIGQIGAGQQNMVGSEEQMRARIGAEAQGIFNAAQTQVNDLLEPLSRTAMSQWETGVAVLSERFKQRLHRVKEWIDERYSGAKGAVLEVVEYVTGLPDWVTDEYEAAEHEFGDGVCDLIREISSNVNGVIVTCEGLIEDARTDIGELFSNLPAELQEWAAGEQARFGEQLDSLHDRAIQTRDDFNRDMANRAAQSVQEVREQIYSLRQAAGGIIGRIVDAVGRFVEDPAKFIIEGLLELLGIPPASFWALVARIQSVISDIAEDPVGFAGHLLTALGQGFQQFFSNVGTHLIGGLLDWLTAGLAAAGITIPPDFSLKSIISFFLELMGITWTRIRRLLAKHIGEENVALIERAYELVSSLIEQGPQGIFEMIKDRLDPRQILDQVLEAAKSFLVEALITQVSVRIIALFNPAGAILQALEAVYRVLKWIFENAARIFTLVETVVGGIANLVAGNIGPMANAVETALSRLIGPVIDFLADYIGLGDLPNKIKETIEGMQNWIEGILDQVIGWLAERARGLLRTLGIGGEQGEENDQRQEGDSEVGKTISFSAAGESHRLWINVQGTSAKVMMASSPEEVTAKLDDWQERLEAVPEERRTEAQRLLTSARQALGNTQRDAQEAVQEKEQAEREPNDPQAGQEFTQADEETEAVEQSLAEILEPLCEVFEETFVDSNPEQLKVAASQMMAEEVAAGLPLNQVPAATERVKRRIVARGADDIRTQSQSDESILVSFRANDEYFPLGELRRTLGRGRAPPGRTVQSATRLHLVSNHPITNLSSILPRELPSGGLDPTIPTGGGVVNVQENEIQLLTWNSSPTRKTGGSHAEAHTTAVFESELAKEALKYIESIEMRNFNYSACSSCSDALVGMLRQICAAQRGTGQVVLRRAEIYWTRLYGDEEKFLREDRTTWNTIQDLARAGWTIHAPTAALPNPENSPGNVVAEKTGRRPLSQAVVVIEGTIHC
ncbi:MAG: DUF4157 domain-containing protein [Nitrosospira sp.]|nr:DUF4157 domain-containing protein [Nitrosospira sp.]